MDVEVWPMTRHPAFEVYEAPDGHHWRLRAANGKVLASGEAFSSRKAALKSARLIADAAAAAALWPVEWVEK